MTSKQRLAVFTLGLLSTVGIAQQAPPSTPPPNAPPANPQTTTTTTTTTNSTAPALISNPGPDSVIPAPPAGQGPVVPAVPVRPDPEFTAPLVIQNPNPGSAVPAQMPAQDQDSVTPLPMTKQEMKEQRKKHKLEEKAATAQAKADKENAEAADHRAKALKQENKSADAADKANNPQ